MFEVCDYMTLDSDLEKLSERDEERYDRQIMIDGFGKKGQRRLKSTTALVAGAGGLGSPVLIYLAVAGVGKLRIVDNDEVELSNLNRQVLYGDEDIGRGKAEVAQEKLRGINGDIDIQAVSREITDDSIGDLAKDCDLIVDCMDNYPTRYVLNRAALKNEIPFFHAAVSGMQGQATTIIPGETACLKCIVPTPPPPEKFPVLGATPGLLGCIQAHEVIKYVVGVGELLKNELLIVDEGTEFSKVEVQRNPKCEECGSL